VRACDGNGIVATDSRYSLRIGENMTTCGYMRPSIAGIIRPFFRHFITTQLMRHYFSEQRHI